MKAKRLCCSAGAWIPASVPRLRENATVPANLALLHALYGQRTEKRERRAFEDIADFYAIQQRLLVKLDHFRAIGGSALTDKSINVPENELETGPAADRQFP